jgi:stage II sporulation protein D
LVKKGLQEAENVVMGTVRRGSIALLAPAVVLAIFAGRVEARPQSLRAANALVITGHGFGHGVGLSQWGAEQRARAGQSYDRILAFYYPGTVLATVPTATTNVRVLISEQQQLRLASTSPFTVRDPGGRRVELPAGAYPVAARDGAGPGRLSLPVTAEPGATPLLVGGTRYPGSVTIRRSGRGLQAIVTLPLERYLVGVVSSENYGSWPQDALRAQAVASRTYALSRLNPAAPFDVYNDDRSQNYHGLVRDFASAAAAVAATAGKVLLFDDRPIEAYFTASNGGLTRAADDAWGSPLPYLVSRSDPYDAGSPVHTWGPVNVPIGDLRAAFPELPTQISGAEVTLTRAKRAATVTLTALDGSRYEIPGATFQARLNLRSTFFTLATS